MDHYRAVGTMVLLGDTVLVLFGVCALLIVITDGDSSVPNRIGTPAKPYFKRQGKNGRVEYISVKIKKSDLDTGTKTNSRTRAYIKKMGALEGDDAGHLIAKRLGGSGTDTFNIVPQNQNCNRGMWKNKIEKSVYDCVHKGNQATMEVKPKYRGKEKRPYQLQYKWICIVRRKHVVHKGVIPNPKPPKKCAGSRSLQFPEVDDLDTALNSDSSNVVRYNV